MSENQISRTEMNVWDVFGNVGGIQQVFYILCIYLLKNYSKLCFIISATNAMFKVNSKNLFSSLGKDQKLNVSFFDKLKLLFNIRPNLVLKKLIELS